MWSGVGAVWKYFIRTPNLAFRGVKTGCETGLLFFLESLRMLNVMFVTQPYLISFFFSTRLTTVPYVHASIKVNIMNDPRVKQKQSKLKETKQKTETALIKATGK